MKVGVYQYTQNWWDSERFVDYEEDGSNDSLSKRDADNDLFQEDLRFAQLVEELGFDDLWTVEHHFSPYAETTNPLQYLAYWAGKTERIGLGTMVIVLPWHQPLRVAEEIVNLQYFLGDRDLTIGVGRGAARREYGGLDIPMSESRGRFAESLEIIKLALSQERFSFEGEHYTVPDVSQRPQSPHISLRPTPLDPDRLLNNFYGAWGSPTSGPILAQLGLKPLIIPQRLMVEYEAELAAYYAAGSEKGHEAANPITAMWVYCSEKEDAVAIGHEAYTANLNSADINYEMSKNYHGSVAGYEIYEQRWENVEKAKSKMGSDLSPLLNDMIVGTPDQCLAKIQEMSELIHPSQWNFSFKFGNLTKEQSEKSMRLFAKEVLPAVQEMEVKEPKLAAVQAS